MLEQEREFNSNMKYFDELKRSMNYIASKSDTIFIGQAVEYPGTAMTNTLSDVNEDKLIEFPVTEEFQMGASIGLAMGGYVPVTIYPRWNFLILAVNQVVNHLDKMKEISNNSLLPKVIIRTGIGSERPLHPQHQHIGDFTEAFKLMATNLEIIRLEEPEDIYPAYQNAYDRDDGVSSIIIEYGDYYSEK
jgi:pyruvate/2-oxoglutarate/acetoin dehydrogenase E1 component